MLIAYFAICRNASDAATTVTSVVASLSHKELGRSQVPTLEVGDVIEADIWKSKLGGGKVTWGEKSGKGLVTVLEAFT